MRRKHAQPSLPNLYFRDGILSVPGYTFEKATLWADTGSLTSIAEGNSLKDGSSVLAKIAPAHTNGSMCLEREAHILERLAASPEAASTCLNLIDYFTVPRDKGDCVVLLLAHPGFNILGRFFPSSRVNDLLLAEQKRPRPSTSHGDIYMMGIEEPELEEMEAFDVMDLASFLEFAIQATHCLEILHKTGLIHREVRANAFHLNAHSGLVRFVHFGNRAISLEQFGGPSALVIRAADAFEEVEKYKVKEALCYLAPEQTGGMDTTIEDHRTDLYAIGILFWTLLVGRGIMPFEGGPLELLHAIVQKRPMPVHEVRRDVPQVLALVIEKLLAKNPDLRYQSAEGLKADLLECQRRLLVAVSSASDQSMELIPIFEIATQDRYTFTIPTSLFGRERELEVIRNVVRNVSTSYARHVTGGKGYIALSASGSGSDHHTRTSRSEDHETSSTKSESSRSHVPDDAEMSPRMSPKRTPPLLLHETQTHTEQSIATSSTAPSSVLSPTTVGGSDGLRRVALAPSKKTARAHAVIIIGPPGAGKSSLVLANQAKWRSHGLWGQAKFQNADTAPFSALLSCLSSVLRQLMVFHTDLHRFVGTLKARLGPQLQNVPLLYQGAEELRDVLSLFDINIEPPRESLSTRELRARFQSLVENVFVVLAETRLFALFIDDLHEADESSLDLIGTLMNSKSRMLMFITLRNDQAYDSTLDKVKGMAPHGSRTTWLYLEPLPFSAISTLVSRTLHRSKEECTPLARVVHAVSGGNAFSARNVLTTLHRQRHITFDWERNYWQFNMPAIEATYLDQQTVSDPSDPLFLTQHLHEFPDEARRFILWASFFGATFKVTEVALLMDWEDPSTSSGSGSEDDGSEGFLTIPKRRRDGSLGPSSHSSIRGLQTAIQEGWLVQRGRDMCAFTHDRYRQAAETEVEKMPDEIRAKMSFRIVLMMLMEPSADVYRVSEHAKRCLPLLREHAKREELVNLMIESGDAAWARGAHELALQSLVSAKSLLTEDAWDRDPTRTLLLFTRLAALSNWKGDFNESDSLVEECLAKASHPEDKARLLRLRSRNHWMRNSFEGALRDNLLALHILGVDVNAAPTRREADAMFEQVKNEILAVGFDDILAIPRAADPRTDLAVALLNDAGTHAYWSNGDGFSDVIGLTTIQLALRSGISPGTSLGFFFALAAAAERRDLYRFSADLGKLALRIADRYGSSFEKCRVQVLFCAMVSGYDNVHVRTNISRLDQAMKFGNSSGDRVYTGFASLHTIACRIYICDHLSELIPAAEESVNDIKLWTPGADAIFLAMGHLNLVRALGGYTYATSPETCFDTDNFKESEYAESFSVSSGNLPLTMNWYNAFKVVAFYCLGFADRAAELGFFVYHTRDKHPNHRHVRYSLFFHSLALIACMRDASLSRESRDRYMKQVEANHSFLRKWLSPSPVNNSAWVALIDAELASLLNRPNAFKLYDIAVKLAVNNDWLMEEAWALYLEGSHYVRCGVEGLGGELQRRGISRHSQWGAQAVVNYLSSTVGSKITTPPKRNAYTSDVAVQTDNVMIGHNTQASASIYEPIKQDSSEDDDMASLSASDLASILKWSKEISSDINLTTALQRLTEIATDASGAQAACVVIAREAGDYTVATSMVPPGRCQVYENPKPIRNIADPLQKVIMQHALNAKENIYYDDITVDSRYTSEAEQSPHKSLICIPIFSNRGQTFGAVYLASKYRFSRNTFTMLTLLCQQASISIANALLFRSVQAGTRENLKMIAAQRDALEAARKSREDALKATKIKSNFLASMSHELRTPFSSFYGLLDILSGTELNAGQREIVQTAKQSCELLLKIIDSILDYSKLEASAVKLEYTGFLVEDIIADCMELLLPMAAKKLDLSFNIEPDVPESVMADYARIRQVLMNLIGNAVKFTSDGSVKVVCSVDRTVVPPPGEVQLKFVIQDSGIGLSSSDVDLLFVPFQQADNSSTRRFGGTGLGLSISRGLVKLMGGAIGVQSELGVGSIFWFTIPVKIFESPESRKLLSEIDYLKTQLVKLSPPRVLLSSPSEITLMLLSNMLDGFEISTSSSVPETEAYLRNEQSQSRPLDFVILDDQSETHADELARLIESLQYPSLKGTKLVHLYTPTTDALTGHTTFSSNTPGVVKMTKPPRRARLLQTLASLKNLLDPTGGLSKLTAASAEDAGLAKRTLYGNVLIAEDNPVAQKLLVKQLERYDIKVTPTSNGEQALSEWEAHEPGYFSVALFDHHMPVCDGVEAAKRLRLLESKRRVATILPSKTIRIDTLNVTNYLIRRTVVALSADCQESTKQLCLSAGMNLFLSKPLKKNDLISLLSSFGSPQPPADVQQDTVQ
ncbi:histidine kinase [Neolentinus lepideus HHB14362 ss-1]|uniref:Histidine kinase n=1 Tax=Neolentinus lepideus HHB14362 ss-1 TaxID=1314782 RepID=A0A165Q963_9AGAM|nr:histidine kinase [Neolentinus lepideus HHB14362 ss-1]